MALSHSPKTVTDGLVFMYDTGNKKSYKGEPTTNLLNYTTEFNSWTAAKNSGTTPTVTADTSVNPLGFANEPMADKVYLPDDGTYPRVQQYFTPSSTSTHTFSVWIRSLSGNCDCFLGAFRNSPWSLPGSSVKSITGEWQRFTFSWTPPDTTTHVIYMGSHDTAAQKGNTLEFWGAQMEAKSHATQFVNGTRSATAGLIDRAGNSTIDLSNTSFDSDAQITLDGTDEYIDLGSDVSISPDNQGWTTEYWFNTNSASTLQHFNSAENDEFNANWLAILSSKLAVWNRSPGYWKYGSTQFSSNTWYQAVFICDAGGTNMRFYVNGEAEGGNHVGNVWTASYSSLDVRYIGKYEHAGGHSRYFNGEIGAVKIYDRALTAAEVLQNYNAIKSRFGL